MFLFSILFSSFLFFYSYLSHVVVIAVVTIDTTKIKDQQHRGETEEKVFEAVATFAASGFLGISKKERKHRQRCGHCSSSDAYEVLLTIFVVLVIVVVLVITITNIDTQI